MIAVQPPPPVAAAVAAQPPSAAVQTPLPGPQTGAAPVTPPPMGDWDGEVALPVGLKLRLVLHVAPAGTTLDSPDQNARGVPVAARRDGQAVTVEIGAAHARFVGALSADERTLTGTLAQGGAELPVRFVRRAPGAPAPERRRPQTPRPPFPYASTDVAFPGGAAGVRLAGTLTRPPGPGPVPAVVLIAGSGPQTRDEVVEGHRIFLVLADRLTRAGVAVLRYDKRGIGASTGDARSATLDDLAADARAAFDWLRAQPGVMPGRVGLLGHSEGAEIAPRVAAAGAPAAFLVLLAAPGVPGPQLISAQAGAIAAALGAPPADADRKRDQELALLTAVVSAPDAAGARAVAERTLLAQGLAPAAARAGAAELSSPPFRSLLLGDPAEALRRVQGPVLVVAGSRDLQVLPGQNLPPIRAALRHDARAEVVELPGLNHLLQPARTGAPGEYGDIEITMAPEALDLVAGWVARTTGLATARP